MSITCPGTSVAPSRVICVNHSSGNVPPASGDESTTATISTTGANSINILAGGATQFCYYYGITFKAGSGSSAASLTVAATRTQFENCGFFLSNTSATSGIIIGSSAGWGDLEFINPVFTFSNVSQAINRRAGRAKFKGGSIGGSTFPGILINQQSGTETPATWIFDGFDFSALGSGKTIFGNSATLSQTMQCVNCKINSLATFSNTPIGGAINDLIITDTGSNNSRVERYTYGGPLTTETTIVRSGGASDGTTPVSWKIAGNANNKRLVAIETFQIVQWNALVGASHTVTVEVVNDGTTLTNADIWMEVEYLGTSGFPISSLASTGLANPLATPANLPSSSASWAAGLATPIAQYLQVTITPQMAGLIRVIVRMAKASKTVYVDPLITVV